MATICFNGPPRVTVCRIGKTVFFTHELYPHWTVTAVVEAATVDDDSFNGILVAQCCWDRVAREGRKNKGCRNFSAYELECKTTKSDHISLKAHTIKLKIVARRKPVFGPNTIWKSVKFLYKCAFLLVCCWERARLCCSATQCWKCFKWHAVKERIWGPFVD